MSDYPFTLAFLALVALVVVAEVLDRLFAARRKREALSTRLELSVEEIEREAEIKKISEGEE